MLESRTISIAIARPYAEAYESMAEPRNVSAWAPVPAETFRHVSGMDYAIEAQFGSAVMRFTPHNEFGVLDYWMMPDDGAPTQYVPARLFANEEGCELQLR